MIYYVYIYDIKTDANYEENCFTCKTDAEIWGQETADRYKYAGFEADYFIEEED